MQQLKSWVKSHKRLRKMVRKIILFFKHDSSLDDFTTFEEGFALASDWAEKLPKDFDAIIGVPRSGLIIAGIIASKMGKPLSTPDDFVRGIVWFSSDAETPKINKVLLVEDSVSQARALNKAYDLLKNYNPSLQIKRASLYASKDAANFLDFYYLLPNGPLEWNLLSSLGARVGKLATDLDGVLCENPPVDDNTELDKYESWIKVAVPNIIPAYPIEAIVTSRFEKYRAETELWLKQNGVKYNRLVMFDNGKTRSLKQITKFKAENASATGAIWFWESEEEQAKEISRLMNAPVYCPTIKKTIVPKRWKRV
jgi:hypothetical protein